MTDLHIHSKYSLDAKGEIEDICKEAVLKGIETIAITDHYEFFNDSGEYTFDFKAIRDEIEKCRDIFENKLEILAGIELGQPHRDEERTKKELYMPFDIKIGSIHAMPGKGDIYFYDFTDIDPYEFIESYMKELEALVNYGDFHILAHIGYPLRMMQSKNIKKDYSDCLDVLDNVLKGIIAKGIALEMNAKTLSTWIGEVGPSVCVLKRYKELGGELLTFGSDAHAPSMVGYGMTEAFNMAKTAGFNYLTGFKNTKFFQYKI